VSTQGSPYARFPRALETGNLTIVRAAAAELPTINLDDAHEAAVIRWVGRLCLKRPETTITELRLALAAFERLPEEPEEAEAELRRLARH
jgi:hypothetical protein